MIQDEHRSLMSHVEGLRSVAEVVGEVSPGLLRQGVDDAYRFLTELLIPHADAEERGVYPAVTKILGSDLATEGMIRDHAEVKRLAAALGDLKRQLDLDPLTEQTARDLRRTLYGLYALVRLHFTKEEETLLPLLEAHLSPEQVKQIFRAMETPPPSPAREER
jgi:hemerythrin-like domain-containing protein